MGDLTPSPPETGLLTLQVNKINEFIHEIAQNFRNEVSFADKGQFFNKLMGKVGDAAILSVNYALGDDPDKPLSITDILTKSPHEMAEQALCDYVQKTRDDLMDGKYGSPVNEIGANAVIIESLEVAQSEINAAIEKDPDLEAGNLNQDNLALVEANVTLSLGGAAP